MLFMRVYTHNRFTQLQFTAALAMLMFPLLSLVCRRFVAQVMNLRSACQLPLAQYSSETPSSYAYYLSISGYDNGVCIKGVCAERF